MSKKLTGVIIGAVVLVLLGTGFLMSVSYNNREVDLRNAAAAKQEANQARYDEVWKTIKQVAGVTDKYSSDFKEIYNGIMAGRYEADGKNNPMFKWIQEQNPQLSPDLYTKLANTITAQRAGFTRDQQKLIDIKREHDNLRKKFPSKLFVHVDELEITVVTSAKTKQVFATGEENDVDLF